MTEERNNRLIAMGQMAASLAHEIRNPLGSMELYCSLLKRDLANQPGLNEYAERIHQGIRTLERIMANCLQFAQEIIVRRKTMNSPESILRNTINLAHSKAELCSVSVNMINKNSVPANIDEYLLSQVFLNILLNAVESLAESNVEKKEVLITSETQGGFWKVSIKDNGPGIKQENLNKIFDPFFSTKQGGTGLGLPIVHSIVKAHGAELNINSILNEGTEVVVKVPCGVREINEVAPINLQ